jgi:uncharacterized protein (DUF1501 family)
MSKPASYTDPQVVADITAAAAATGSDYRALVCVFLFGANDNHNTVMPLGGVNRQQYDLYRADQTNVGIPVGQSPTNHLTADWRLHHNLPALKTIWDAGKLGVLMNVGMLRKPMDRARYLTAPQADLPSQLFSHNSQQQQWQQLPDSAATILHGWMGRSVDLAGSIYNALSLSGAVPAMTIAGNQVQMVGYEAQPAYLSAAGATTINNPSHYGSTLLSGGHMAAARGRSEYDNQLQGYFGQKTLDAIDSQALLNGMIAALPATPDGRFTAIPSNTLAQQLKTVARVIHSRTAFEHRRQLFFVSLGGFDNHANLRTNHDALMTTVNAALNAFWLALGDLGVQNDVVTFTESDFGRTLMSNGSNGSDHGWGSHHFILGGAVNGAIYGLPYDMTVNGPQDSGQGRTIPTTSADEYIGTLLRWWGIPTQHLHLVLPNLLNMPRRTVAGLLP